jgi:hypothetical protein
MLMGRSQELLGTARQSGKLIFITQTYLTQLEEIGKKKKKEVP